MKVKRYYHDFNSQFLYSDLQDNPLIYEFDNVIPDENEQSLLYGITEIQPGSINGEFFMTKGHCHLIPSAEIYFCLEGIGLVYQESSDSEIIETFISPGEIVYCKPGFGHRLVNTGNSILKVLCVCRADAGHDYNFEFSQRYFVDFL